MNVRINDGAWKCVDSDPQQEGEDYRFSNIAAKISTLSGILIPMQQVLRMSGLLVLILVLVSCARPSLKKSETENLIQGWVAPGFEEVREEFVRNFKERRELGAACAVYYQGQKVVDLWGGYRDFQKKLPWEEDTMISVFSTTKGLAAMTFAVAHSRGWLNYDEKVATYWPEFVQNGKGLITVRQLLSHEAGLTLLDEELPLEKVKDLEALSGLLARQKPEWSPGERHGYHSSTLGLYMNALLFRVDPKHRSLGRFFQEEIAHPLGAEFYIGLPKEIPESRLAHLEMIHPTSGLFNLGKLPFPMALKVISPWSSFVKSFAIPSGFDPNSRASKEVELPSGNGTGEVRAMAKAYGEFASGGKRLLLRPETLKLLGEEARTPPKGPKDEILGIDTYYSLGFSKPTPSLSFGSSQKAFGTPGAGGSFAFADPEYQLGYAYAMTRMDFYTVDDPREKALRDAVYRSVRRIRQKGGL